MEYISQKIGEFGGFWSILGTILGYLCMGVFYVGVFGVVYMALTYILLPLLGILFFGAISILLGDKV